MPRVLCVWFPKWPLQRAWSVRPELGRAELALFAGQNQRPAITVCSSRAERSGIHIGQPLAEARSLAPKAVFLPADHVADRSALCQLAVDCQRFTPLVGLEEGDHPESLFCDVSGCTHLWNGEDRFLQAVGVYWKSRGYSIQLALASTMGASWALAHTSTGYGGASGGRGSRFIGTFRRGAAVAAGRPGAPRSPGAVDDRRCARTAAPRPGQPVWCNLAAATGPGAGPPAGDLCLRASQRAALGCPRVGSAH